MGGECERCGSVPPLRGPGPRTATADRRACLGPCRLLPVAGPPCRVSRARSDHVSYALCVRVSSPGLPSPQRGPPTGHSAEEAGGVLRVRGALLRLQERCRPPAHLQTGGRPAPGPGRSWGAPSPPRGAGQTGSLRRTEGAGTRVPACHGPECPPSLSGPHRPRALLLYPSGPFCATGRLGLPGEGSAPPLWPPPRRPGSRVGFRVEGIAGSSCHHLEPCSLGAPACRPPAPGTVPSRGSPTPALRAAWAAHLQALPSGAR